MEITTQEATVTAAQMIAKATELENSADNLYMALLAPSLAERAMREDAADLRKKAAAA